MSEAIRRHDLRAAGGRIVSTEVTGGTITAVLQFAELSALRRGRSHLRGRGWTVVRESGLSVKFTANIN